MIIPVIGQCRLSEGDFWGISYFDYRVNIDYKFESNDYQKYRIKSEIKKMNAISAKVKKINDVKK